MTHPASLPYQKEKAWRKSPKVEMRTAVVGVAVSLSVKASNNVNPLLRNSQE